jgi:hypothetical protein
MVEAMASRRAVLAAILASIVAAALEVPIVGNFVMTQRGQRGDLVAEAKRLSDDREDRAEAARVARLMEALRVAR